MATNLVKWWKTRFLNGYKQFTVLMPADSASESGRPSDTEELLSSVSASLSPPPLLRPPPSPAPPPTPAPPPREPCCCGSQAESTPRRELKFEEFECDVAVQAEDRGPEGGSGGAQGGDKSRAPPRQEFSFTLYDLDGHGKITKDDIAGLVTTIYETLGATIQVPHTGSKTIRVRLTVAPENRSSTPQTPQNLGGCRREDPPHKVNKESLLYHNLSSPSKLANNAEQLYSQLNFSPANKSKNEVYYTLHSPTMSHKIPSTTTNNNTTTNNESVHYCQHRSPTMGHKVATVRVCNNESCSSPYKTPTRLLNNDEASLRLCENASPPHLSPKPAVRFCNNETGHPLCSPLVSNVADSPLAAKKLSGDGLRRVASPKSSSLSSPNSPLRPATAARASVSVSSPRSSGRKVASHSSSPARSRRRTVPTAAPAPLVAAPESVGEGRERAYSGTLQRQELLHIIQANMEKNLLALHHNTTQHHAPASHHRKRGDEGQASHSHHRHHSTGSQRANLPSRRAGKSSSSRLLPRKTTRTSVDPANNVISCSHYYLDLAGLESANLCPHCDKGKSRGHARSKSHDTTTHHLLRHKTRELDHARAMAQVVEWLQGAQLGAGGSLPPNVVQEEEEEEEEDGEEVGAETRTHRHIHEHVHHHYHHYTDSQLVV